MKKSLIVSLSVVAVAVSIGTGCGKKDQPAADAGQEAVDSTSSESAQPAPAVAKPDPTTTTSKLPGSTEVMAALDKKDYAGVVRGMMAIKQIANTSDKQFQFANLADEVKAKLFDIGDPAAIETARALRTITGGR